MSRNEGHDASSEKEVRKKKVRKKGQLRKKVQFLKFSLQEIVVLLFQQPQALSLSLLDSQCYSS